VNVLITHSSTPSLGLLARQLAEGLPRDLCVTTADVARVAQGTPCDVLVALWWRSLTKGLLGRVTARKAVIVAIYDHHSWTYTKNGAADLSEALAVADHLVIANEKLLEQLQAAGYRLPPATIVETGLAPAPARPALYPATFRAGWCGNSKAGEEDLKGLALIREAVRLAGVELLIADSSGAEGSDVPHHRMGDWYKGISVLLVGSRSEGTPRTALEALAHGRPVVSTRVGIVRRLLAEGVTGSVVADSPQAMAKAILRWRRAQQLHAQKIQHACLESVSVTLGPMIERWRMSIMIANRWWRKEAPASEAEPKRPRLDMVHSSADEMAGKVISGEVLQGVIDDETRLQGITAQRPLIALVSKYRFLTRTLPVIKRILPRWDVRLLECCQGMTPDLIWSLYPFADGREGAELARKFNRPLVMTLRGTVRHMDAQTIQRALEVYRAARALCPVAQILKDLLVGLAPDLRHAPWHTIPNGVEIPADLAPTQCVPVRPLIVFPTNFNFKEKRVAADRVVAAFRKLQFSGTLIIAGKGRFHPQIGVLGGGAQYVGFERDVLGLVKAADVVIYHSHLDAQPSVVMEAMALGKAVVVGRSKMSGVHEFVDHQETGIIAPTAMDVAREGIALCQDRPRAEKLGLAAAAAVRARWTWDIAAERYERVFEGLI